MTLQEHISPKTDPSATYPNIRLSKNFDNEIAGVIGGEAVTTEAEQAKAGASQARYAGCITASKRVRWDIDADVIRGQVFDPQHKFLPDGLSLIDGDRFAFLDENEKRFLGQVQGRTYANNFGLVERFINAKILEVSSDHLITDSGPCRVPVGTEITFQINYSALLRAMTSPFVTKIVKGQT